MVALTERIFLYNVAVSIFYFFVEQEQELKLLQFAIYTFVNMNTSVMYPIGFQIWLTKIERCGTSAFLYQKSLDM
jgi:hypothetical protein